jgi:type II secretory pathway pseudopilin PulG
MKIVFQSATADRQTEGGFTLVALLAVMSLLALFALAAAENVRQHSQREREKEAIFRGEQVSDAIRSYYVYRGAGRGGVNALPTSMDQLLEGIPKGTKKLQILRVSASRDPLSSSGEWKLIGPTSQDMVQFVTSLTTFLGGTPPQPRMGGIPVVPTCSTHARRVMRPGAKMIQVTARDHSSVSRVAVNAVPLSLTTELIVTIDGSSHLSLSKSSALGVSSSFEITLSSCHACR